MRGSEVRLWVCTGSRRFARPSRARTKDCAGFSIPASEHSTMTSWGREREVDAMRNMLEMYPKGLMACVSDSYDIFKARASAPLERGVARRHGIDQMCAMLLRSSQMLAEVWRNGLSCGQTGGRTTGQSDGPSGHGPLVGQTIGQSGRLAGGRAVGPPGRRAVGRPTGRAVGRSGGLSGRRATGSPGR